MISVGIVDDHNLFRKGMGLLLLEHDDIKVAFDAENGADMIAKINVENTPQVILLDIHMPVMDGYESLKWLKSNCPEIKVLALSTFEDDNSIITMLRSGAGGYLLKGSKVTEVILAIRTLVKTGFYINELVSGKLWNSLQGELESLIDTKLSKNELKFLELCCSELTYKEIADKMFLSPHTIDNYREALFEKFSLRSRSGLVIFAIKNNLVRI